jgi:hypothetical protein
MTALLNNLQYRTYIYCWVRGRKQRDRKVSDGWTYTGKRKWSRDHKGIRRYRFLLRITEQEHTTLLNQRAEIARRILGWDPAPKHPSVYYREMGYHHR